MPHFPVTLAANDFIEVLFAVLFVGISFISWVYNLINGNKPKQKMQRRGPAEAERRAEAQKELDQFLGQSREQSAPPARDAGEPRRPPPPAGRKSRQDVWAEQTGGQGGNPQGKRKDKEKKGPQGKKGKQPTGNKPNPPRPVVQTPLAPLSRPGEDLAARHVQSSIAASVQRDLPHQINLSVGSHLGTFAAGSQDSTGQRAMADTTSRAISPAAALVTMLRSPQGVRQAILINEILRRPDFRRLKK